MAKIISRSNYAYMIDGKETWPSKAKETWTRTTKKAKQRRLYKVNSLTLDTTARRVQVYINRRQHLTFNCRSLTSVPIHEEGRLSEWACDLIHRTVFACSCKKGTQNYASACQGSDSDVFINDC